MQGYSKISSIDENKQAQQLTQVSDTNLPRASTLQQHAFHKYM